MDRERLLRLADYLETKVANSAAATFDMDAWATDCGTASCALGHACTIPEFIRDGLTLEKQGVFYVPVYRDRVRYASGFNAAVEFFGISYRDASNLFDPRRYPDYLEPIEPQDVAERIRELAS